MNILYMHPNSKGLQRDINTIAATLIPLVHLNEMNMDEKGIDPYCIRLTYKQTIFPLVTWATFVTGVTL